MASGVGGSERVDGVARKTSKHTGIVNVMMPPIKYDDPTHVVFHRICGAGCWMLSDMLITSIGVDTSARHQCVVSGVGIGAATSTNKADFASPLLILM